MSRFNEVPMKPRAAVLSLLALCFSSLTMSQTAPAKAPKAEPVVMEYYYTVKWGYQDEFLRLFRKNHLPLLKKYQELGEITKIEMVKPADHLPEPSRWDFKVTLIYRDIQAAFGDTSHHDVIRKQLFPDQSTFEREEQRRFEILLAHWDVPIEPVKLD
jgi:hypothetical protein